MTIDTPITFASIAQDIYINSVQSLHSVKRHVQGKVESTVESVQSISKDDVKEAASKAAETAGKVAKKTIWLGAVGTSTSAGIATGVIVNRIGHEVRTNITVSEKTIENGKEILRFISAPKNRIGLAEDPELRRLQMLGLATEIAGVLIIGSVIGVTAHVRLGTKKKKIS